MMYHAQMQLDGRVTDEAARDVDALDDTRQATWGQRCESVENNGIIRSDDEHLVFFRKLLVSNAAESLDSEVDAPLATALVQSALQAFFPSLKSFSSRNGEITNSDDHSPRAGKNRLLALHPLGSSGSGFCRQLAAMRPVAPASKELASKTTRKTVIATVSF